MQIRPGKKRERKKSRMKRKADRINGSQRASYHQNEISGGAEWLAVEHEPGNCELFSALPTVGQNQRKRSVERQPF